MAKRSRGRTKQPAGKPKHKHEKSGLALAADGGSDMDDEVDAFHKKRDMIPFDVHTHSGGESDDDEMEQAVLNLTDNEESDSEHYDRDGDGDEDIDCDANEVHDRLSPLAKKIARQAKFLQQRMGSTGGDIQEDESEEEKRTAWGRNKSLYFGGDNADFELLSSDEELLAEEDEALRIQKEKANQLSMEDFGLDDADAENDNDNSKKSLKDIFPTKRSIETTHVEMPAEDTFENYFEIKKDLGALAKEEQMEVVYSFAPELIGLLLELNDTLGQLKIVDTFFSKMKDQIPAAEGGMHYLEMKQRVLLVYCQAIAFYLLLKSEGCSVRDHPVVSRLVEIKSLLEKIKQIDAHVPSETVCVKSAHRMDHKSADSGSTRSDMGEVPSLEPPMQVDNMDDLVKVAISKDYANMNTDTASQVEQLGLQSKEMLKIRAVLEEKLKKKGLYGHMKTRRNQSQNLKTNLMNKRMESLADFDDEAAEPVKRHNVCNGLSLLQTTKLSQLVATKGNKSMMVSGDDDLPKRDDIGERRKKHELRILSRVGAGSMGDDDGEQAHMPIASRKSIDGDNNVLESEDEFYREAKRKRAAKVSAREELYSRAQADSLQLPQDEADGKRQITYQIEKNRGLTRNRKKLIKNPRKKYKLKHQKAEKRRQGQVRSVRKPSGPYGGEAAGISIGVSHSVRFK